MKGLVEKLGPFLLSNQLDGQHSIQATTTETKGLFSKRFAQIKILARGEDFRV
jgi:hypothetical protein